MTVGFVILAHERQDRVRQLARHLLDQGARVVVHLDQRIRPEALDGIDVIQTQASDWGRFSLVEASLDGAAHLLAQRDISHVALISGACLPVRPITELQSHLAAHTGSDFIESVDIERDKWVEEGLSEERFTMWHPFSHRHQPKLFSASVEIQRTLRIHRKLPDGLKPHLGSQWWVLCSDTLRAILQDQRLPAWKRFFRSTWIPDESFFQTIVRVVADQPPLPSLHFGRFDPRGKPYVFHDEHSVDLRKTRAFLARKIDPDAEALYRTFLGGEAEPCSLTDQVCAIAAARARETQEGKGLFSAGRFPRGTTQIAVETAAPYVVLVSDDDVLLRDLETKLAGTPGIRLHGQVFAEDAVHFMGDVPIVAGNLTANTRIRAYRQAQYLQRLIWAQRGSRTGFFYRPTIPAPEAGQILGDGNARLILLGDGDRVTDLLRRPLPTKRRLVFRKPRPHPIWAWRRVMDPAYSVTTPGIEDLRQVLRSDWLDPQGWQVPKGTRVFK